MHPIVFRLSSESTQANGPEYLLPQDVVLLSAQDGTARLLHMNGDTCAIDAGGAHILKITLQKGSAAAVESLVQRHRMTRQRAENEVVSFLQRLERHRLISRRGESNRLESLRTLTSFMLLAPALWLAHVLTGCMFSRASVLLAIARMSIGLLGWTRTVAVWKWYFPEPEPREIGEVPKRLVEIDQIVRQAAATHMFNVQCKERALCCFALNRGAGLPAELVVGISLCPFSGHCWVESGSSILSDDPEYCRRYSPVIRYA